MAFWSDASDAFGEQGPAGLRRLMNSIREFFRVIPPEGLSTTFVFMQRVSDSTPASVGASAVQVAAWLAPDDIPGYRQRIEAASVVVIQVEDDGRYTLAEAKETPPLEPLSERALVFVNEDGRDRFVIGGRSKEMPQLVTGARSNFAVPTVSGLEEALRKYGRQAANVSCPILAEAWVGGRDGARLVFRNRPEAYMRRSLELFLMTRIAEDVSVRPEHNTDETRPVDLLVTWFRAKQKVLIEIKWLGRSLTRNSDGTQFTTYTPARAQQGADQLVEYLDRERSTDPDFALRGYLAVFDGRRLNVKGPCAPIARDDALHFRDREIVLTRDFSERDDVAPLVRYFLEPRASHFAQPQDLP